MERKQEIERIVEIVRNSRKFSKAEIELYGIEWILGHFGIDWLDLTNEELSEILEALLDFNQ